jgi:phosphinothricin acetyltransferase
MPPQLIVRPATAADIAEIAAIYGVHVRQGLASFEESPPDEAEMRRRMAGVRDAGLPYLAATRGGVVVGFAYAGPYRARPAYRHTVEDTVYVDAKLAGQGIGRALLQPLIDACATAGRRQMVAVIGDSANAGSIGLHAALGFRQVGILRSVGFKFGRWVDSVLMQRNLGKGDASPP